MSQPVVELFNISAKEEAGELVSATTVFDVEIDYQPGLPAHEYIEQALSASGVPQVGERYSQYNPYLAVATRSPEIIKPKGGDGLIAVRVTVEYELWRYKDGVPESIDTSLEQIETQKDRDGTPITVAYKGVTKPVALDVPINKMAFHESSVYQTADAQGAAALIVNAVNSVAWRGQPAGYILCTRVAATPKNRKSSPMLWMFDCDFEIKGTPGGWVYVASFKEADGTHPDPNPPATKNVNWHKQFDFSLVFG